MRKSAWRGTWEPNKRPFVTCAPDAYVSLQGETTVIGCGECQRKVNYNDYITGISTEASVDAPPGSATINLSIPDNDINDFFVDGQFLIQPMMEVEIFAKGYYLVGGFPQYYRIFWGIVSSVSKSWSNGVSSMTVSCKDILRWWELTNATTNPAFLEAGGSSAGGYQLFQNQFSGQNPYATIAQLAKDAMGDFFYTTGSFTSYTPEKGPEVPTLGNFMQDVMSYWQLKFANIQTALVMFGTSGQAYSFSAVDGTVSPNQMLETIIKEENRSLKNNHSTVLLNTNPKEMVTAKTEIARAGDVEFFQNETQSKLSLAMHARDQLGFEFYCDTTGDIIFKPPFYNLNVLPNKPVSWIQDFDIIDDQLTDSEAEVVTQVTSSGNAFGGAIDYGLNDEITTPRTGVYDFHLLRRYGWRRADLQLEWAGNPRKLFFYLLDWMDRLNAKRQNGTITMPMRPELRMGFPVWVPKYDSFFYVQGIAHQYSVGGQATTTVTLTAKRSKFIAPKGIGEINKAPGETRNVVGDKQRGIHGQDQVYTVTFPGRSGSNSGLGNDISGGAPAIVRDPKTGKVLGFPNVVMVFKSTYSGKDLEKIMESQGKHTQPNTAKPKGKGPDRNQLKPQDYNKIHDTLIDAQSSHKDVLIARLRAHRYEAGMTNAGAYDYAWDKGRNFREFALIPLSSYQTHPKPDDDAATTTIKSDDKERPDKEAQAKLVTEQQNAIKAAKANFDQADSKLKKKSKELADLKSKYGKSKPPDPDPAGLANFFASIQPLLAEVEGLQDEQRKAAKELDAAKKKLASVKTANPSITYIPQLNVLVRPVSDEFGFEVIGHNRYGRGAYIDRGKLQVPVKGADGPSIANQLNIQFAPTGGFLTDSGTGSNVDGQAVNFSSLFEQMSPDDYKTGASFTGTVKPGEGVSNVQTTSASTYTNLINTDKGTGLYIEADATRRAKTLGEMTPTIELGISTAFDPSKCGCGLNRANWLSLLPTNLISAVLDEATSEGEDKRYTEDGAAAFNAPFGPSEKAKQVEPGSIITSGMSRQGAKGGGQVLLSSPGSSGEDEPGILSSKGFFEILDDFLTSKFSEDIQANVKRERAYTLGGIDNPANVDTNPLGLGDDEQDNVLGDPDNPLFGRASQGDPAALAALQKQANFNFGQTSDSLKNFTPLVNQAGKNAADRLNQISKQPIGSPVSATTSPAPQYQPPAPTLSDPINQRRFDNAGQPQYTDRVGNPIKSG